MKKLFIYAGLLLSFSISANSYEKPVQEKYCLEFSYCKHVIASSKKHRLDPALTMAVLLHESIGGKNPNVVGKRVYVSLKYGISGWYRAQGLMQVMPYNFGEVPPHLWRVPSVNIERGSYLLSRCQKKYGPNFLRTVSCYNMGEYNNKVNYRYVQAVARHYSILKKRK